MTHEEQTATSIFWSLEINGNTIRAGKREQSFFTVANAIFFFIGVSGVGIFLWQLFPVFLGGALLIHFFSTPNAYMAYFWLTVIFDMVLLFRVSRHHDDLQKSEIGRIPEGTLSVNAAEYLSVDAKKSLESAWQTTIKYGDGSTTPIHLFIALLGFPTTKIFLSRLGVAPESLRIRVGNILARQTDYVEGQVVFSPETVDILKKAFVLAQEHRQKNIDIAEITESLCLNDPDIAEMMYDLGVTTDHIKNMAAWIRIRKRLYENWRHFKKRSSLRPTNKINRAMTAVATPMLDAFSKDFTLFASYGSFMPCIGRDKEIDSIINVMKSGARGALLLGEDGIGKKAIVEGIAQLMAAEDVPEFMQDRRLVALDIPRLISGTTVAGAQQRLLRVFNEIKRSGNIILYIPNIHQLVGINQGGTDLADYLTQAVGAGFVNIIATTTPQMYRQHIENRSSLENALEIVKISEVKGNEAIQILESKVGAIEFQENVFFLYEALEALVKMSDRYLHERYLPEKAIEMMQEVAATVASQKGKNSSVTAEDVASLLSKKTSIPLTQLTADESDKLLNLEQLIHERVVGQEEAVSLVASSIRRARAEMRDERRPIATLLFLGPTGVGKTEVAKAISHSYFGSEQRMIRFDMSEYQNQQSLDRLIGTGDRSGFLVDAVRKNQFSLLLLDEFEKAHPDILNIFLQVMDDGRLTGSDGRTVDFTNTIVIATSNAGSIAITEGIRRGDAIDEIRQDLIDNRLTEYFRPELINRFDGVVVFKPLTEEDVKKIAILMLKRVEDNLEKRGIFMAYSDQTLQELARLGYHPEYGARALRRVIQQKIEDTIAEFIISGKLSRRDTILFQTVENATVQKARTI